MSDSKFCDIISISLKENKKKNGKNCLIVLDIANFAIL